MTFALGLILGLTVGGSLGLLTAAMCFAARELAGIPHQLARIDQ